MSITIKGVTSGGVDLKAPDTGSNTTVTLPSATGTLLPTDGNGSALTNLTSANLVGALPALDGSAVTGLTSANLVGALPALDGSSLTGVGVSGIVSASSSGTAISIASNNNVGVGIITPTMHTGTGMQLHSSGSDCRFHISNNTVGGGVNDGAYLFMGSDGTFAIMQMESADIRFISGGGTVLDITSDGRGKSQFTAKAWIQLNMSTPAIKDSHNHDTITDISTGHFVVSFTVNVANGNYAVSTGVGQTDSAGTSNIASDSFRLMAYNTSGTKVDSTHCMAITFGD